MAYNYSKLKGRIVEKFGTMAAFADALGMTRQAISAKMTGKVGFSRDNIVHWAKLLDISKDDYGAYFFTEKV